MSINKTRWQCFLAEMRSTYKSMDTEEKWDIWVVRPIGFIEASICRKLHIHPNAITIVSILFGAASGYFFIPGNVGMVLIGALLLFFANTLDSADGQLARMTKQYTMLGRVLDGFAGDVWFFSIYMYLMFRMKVMLVPFTTVEWGWWAIVLGLVCGIVFHSTQSTIADYYRNVHLHFLEGNGHYVTCSVRLSTPAEQYYTGVAEEDKFFVIFDTQTGEVVPLWDMFKVSEEQARRTLGKHCVANNVSTTAEEYANAIDPEHVCWSSEGFDIYFPAGTFQEHEHKLVVSIDTAQIKSILTDNAL